MEPRTENEQKDRDDLADAVWHMPKLPRTAKRMDRLRWIVHHSTAAKIEGQLMDGFTASMLVQIHDKLNEANRVKFLDLSLLKMTDVGWKLLKG